MRTPLFTNKTKHLLFIFLSLFILSATSVLAEDSLKPRSTRGNVARVASAAGERKEDIKDRSEEIKQRLGQLKEGVASRASEVKQRVSEARKEKIKEFTQKMENRLQAAVERLSNIQGRIEQRITELKNSGKDTTQLESLLSQAKAKQQSAQNDLNAAKASLDSITSQDDAKRALAISKDALTNIKNDLKDWHQALKDIVRQLEVISP